MSESAEDKLFRVEADLRRQLRDADLMMDDMDRTLKMIVDNGGLSKAIWQRIAEHLEMDEDDMPISYDPTPVAASDLLKLERRIVRLEHQINGRNQLEVPA
jgi:hypothetical protein